MSFILIHPYSRPLRNGKPNPKNYPQSFWWDLLAQIELPVVQIGAAGEAPLVSDFRAGLSLEQIEILICDCAVWIAVDSFLPHLANHTPKPGIVLWSVSDPLIYGYPQNTNLLKGREYLSPKQFATWEEIPYREDAFVSVDVVLAQITAILNTAQ